MKIKIENEKYQYLTDNSNDCEKNTAFLITKHNKKYQKKAEENNCIYFISPNELFKKWNLSKIKIIGITGTNGKTTSTNIIAHILKNLNQKVAVSGTEGVFLHSKNNIEQIAKRTLTTPEIFNNLINLKKAKEAGANFFVMEVGSHGIVQGRTEGLEFLVKIFTNLTQDHLDYHKTMKEYSEVKSSFFQDDKSFKIINFDDKLIKYNKNNSFTYSLNNSKANIYSKNIKISDGIKAEIFFENKKYILKSKLIGLFNLYNILGSILAVKNSTNFSMEEIIKSLENFTGVTGRMELIYSKKNLKIISDYAHTPDAVENVLKSLNNKEKENYILTIVGAGGDRDKTKRPTMAKFSCENSDFVILTSDNPRNEKPENILNHMEKGVENKFDNYKIIVDRKEAIKFALDKFKKNSSQKMIIAILGKGNENYMEIKNKKIPYSDKEEVLKNFN